MKKVGIVTYYYKNYNYGGLLQAYALPTVLKEKFHLNAEQISYDLIKEPQQKKKIGFYQIAIYIVQSVLNKKLMQRENAFEIFMEKIPHSKKIYEYDSIKECGALYDIFICGGDQIWNDHKNKYGLKNTEIYTLQFAPKNKKKFSYSPSMAKLEITESFRKVFAGGIKDFKAISIREEQSKKIIQEMTTRSIETVVDPVLLLLKEDWKRILKKPEIKEKYLLCYLLGDNVDQRKFVKKIARREKLKIVTIPHILESAVRKCDLFFGDIHDYTSGPDKFLGLIENAELVITDSFHACVFSMIFEKRFGVFERNKMNEPGNMNSRIYGFLKEYHLENQLITDKEIINEKNIPKVDFSYAKQWHKKRRAESLNYLERALNA